MNEPLIECVPNFSDGRDMQIINQITDEIERTAGVRLIHVDPGKATNRTVVTFVGPPEAVCEAAFRAVKKASGLIDMSRHHGEHPRIGATDVCPLVPVANISMKEVVVFARGLAQRIGEELHIPVYCYESAATEEKRINLANCRQGEYEGLADRICTKEWKPDYGPDSWNDQIARSGATAVGARNFLIAYNINLNTTSRRRANSVAFDIREKGRIQRTGNPITGKIVRDTEGKPVYIPGMLKSVKAIGWYIEEYKRAQISINLTNLEVTPLHIAFDTACERAATRGLRVTGSELIGLIPLKAMLDAGRYFLYKQNRSTGIPEREIIHTAVKSLGLDELAPFDPDKKIIEYILRDQKVKNLADLSLNQFSAETASESPAPGGGSVAAYLGTLAASLGTMVANISAHKPGWDDNWKTFSDWADRGEVLRNELLKLMDEDTRAFNEVMAAFKLPSQTEEEKKERQAAIQKATRTAMEVPLKVMQKSFKTFAVIRAMAHEGNPASVSDAGVGAICARSAIAAAFLNIKINAKSCKDQEFVNALINEGKQIDANAFLQEEEILNTVNDVISGD